MAPSFVFVERSLTPLGGLGCLGHDSTLRFINVALNYRKEKAYKASTTSFKQTATGDCCLASDY